jgi:hypothetical protein
MSDHTSQPDNDNEPRLQEHRCSKRHRCKKDSALRLMQRSKYKRHEAVIYDVSPRGLGLLIACKLEPGITIAIFLKQDLSQASDIVSAKVTHATAQPDGRWLVGCSLSRRLSDGELSKLLMSEVNAHAAGAEALG